MGTMRPERRAIGDLFGREFAINNDACVMGDICVNTNGAVLTRQEINNWPMSVQTEYATSGLCRWCQIRAFDEGEPYCTCDNPCCEADIGVGVINCGSQHCRIHGLEAR